MIIFIFRFLQAKETEGNLYKEKIKNMENDFKHMHEQLSSEIKLLSNVFHYSIFMN